MQENIKKIGAKTFPQSPLVCSDMCFPEIAFLKHFFFTSVSHSGLGEDISIKCKERKRGRKMGRKRHGEASHVVKDLFFRLPRTDEVALVMLRVQLMLRGRAAPARLL